MGEPRLNLVSTWLGQRGAGKSWHFRKEIEPREKKKILVLDTIDHEKYRDHPQLGSAYTIGRASDIKRWKSGRMRIIAHDHTETFKQIEAHLWNCTIVLEDAKKYCGRSLLKDEIFNMCINTKQRNWDMIFMFQTWKASYTDLYDIGDNLLVFKTKGPPDIRLDRFDNKESILETYQRVRSNSNPHYCEKYDL